MPEIEVKPFILTDVDLTLGGNDYAASVSQVEIAPNGGQLVSWKGLKKGSVFNFPTEPTWQLNLGFAQDFETAQSLSNYLFQHYGDTVPGTFAPKSGGGHWTFDAILVPGSIGGQGDAVATASVTLGLAGKPVWVPAAG